MRITFRRIIQTATALSIKDSIMAALHKILIFTKKEVKWASKALSVAVRRTVE